jgi:2-C-methyl-D-erythritol 4-phosphate cytidylyltransferase
LTNFAIIVAAGEGKRAGAGRAKQFREISGTPIIIHTLRRFEHCTSIERLVLVAPPAEVNDTLALTSKYELRKVGSVVPGGRTRLESVWAGLQAVDARSAGVVAVHDGVRPLVTAEEIDLVVAEATENGAAILATPLVETVKESKGRFVERTLDRGKLWRAQTPQCFRYDLLRRAYEKALDEDVEATDDSMLVERLGIEVSIVEGGSHNLKITTTEDIALAEFLLKSSQ